MSEWVVVLAFASGFLIGALVMFAMANRAIDDAFDEWQRDHPDDMRKWQKY